MGKRKYYFPPKAPEKKPITISDDATPQLEDHVERNDDK